MLDRYTCDCMVLIINIKNGIKERACGHENCNTSQELTIDGSVKVREFLHTRVIIWVNTILNHIDIRVILPKYEDPCMVYVREWYQKQKYRPTPIPYWL